MGSPPMDHGTRHGRPSLVIFACGVLWLGRFVGWENVLQTGFFPFIPGDLIKIAIATAILPAGWKLLGTRQNEPGA